MIIKNIFKIKRYAFVLFGFSLMVNITQAEIYTLNDQALRDVNGQGLMSLSYITPNDSVNQNKQNIGFYKLAMEGNIELNTNIRRLQLGCGGVNGAGGCDIDIDYLSLSGVSDTHHGRAASSAVISNPFIQFAIKNPDHAATREVAGFRLSAEAIQGLLTFGLENSANKSGINSFSGYLKTQQTTGTVKTAAVRSGLTQGSLGKAITGRAKSSNGFIRTNFNSTDYNLTLSAASGKLTLPSQEITGQRINSANLKGKAVVSGINLGGTIRATTGICFFGCIKVAGNLSGRINNLGVNVSVNEDLGFIHKVDLAGTAASLSLQNQSLIWPDAKSTAHTGWWLELSNPIDIGDVSPLTAVDITKDVVRSTLNQVNGYLGQDSHAVDCGRLALSCVLAGRINAGNVNLANSGAVQMNLSNLVLKNQSFAPNCYGGLKFC